MSSGKYIEYPEQLLLAVSKLTTRHFGGLFFEKIKGTKIMSNSNSLQTYQFQSYKLRVIVDDNGEFWFIAKDVCDVLELTDVSMSISRLDDDEKLIQKIFVSGQNRNVMTINESGLYSLMLTSNKPEAKGLKKFVTSEVLPSIRKTGSYSHKQQAQLPSFEEALKGITVLADYLRLSNVGRIALVKPVVEQYGINAALPDYVNDAPPSELSAESSKPVSTASALLKQHGITMSAVKFNQQLHQHGVIKQLSRKSSKGVKNYWSIADGYLEYGKNDTSTSNPLEVQIHWYIHKFSELLDLVLVSDKAA